MDSLLQPFVQLGLSPTVDEETNAVLQMNQDQEMDDLQEQVRII